MSAEIYIIQTTLPGSWIEAEVGAFSQLMLESGSACVQHSPLQSMYKWEGEIKSSQEWGLQLKVTKTQLEKVLSSLKENHPYEIPQIIHWLAEATPEYADWVHSA
ncbi:MAG: divalent cation tolerance protein CutA [Candidatus Poseidoniales archaeon]|nr:divalent cation tolerance protein CutA [Candidatus Poseidoniales archaeon]